MASIQLYVDGVKVYDNGVPLTTAQLAAAMQAAADNQQVLKINGGTFNVTSPIVVTFGGVKDTFGFDGGGCKFNSSLGAGQDIITYKWDGVTSGSDIRYLQIRNFTINGNGTERDGLVLESPGADAACPVYCSQITDVNVKNAGRHGIRISGDVFESSIFNVWTHGNHDQGIQFENNAGGVVSAISMFGGGHRKNLGHGLNAIGGPRDIKSFGQYYCENGSDGCWFETGMTGMWGCGFENNVGSGVAFQNYANLWGCTASTYGPTDFLVNGYLAGGNVLIEGSGVEYYGGAGDTIKVATINGDGTHKAHTLNAGDASLYTVTNATLHQLDSAT